MKLSLTNSPIGFIVLIDYAHQGAAHLDDDICFVLTREKRSGRAAERSATASGLAELRSDKPDGKQRRVQLRQTGVRLRQLLDKALQWSPIATHTLPLIDLVVIAGWLHPFPFRTRP